MKLTDYEWSLNPRGLHNSGPFRPFDITRYTRLHLGWAKLVAGGDEYIEEAADLIAAGITPIVRIERTEMGAMAVPDDWYDTYAAYLSAGVRWFELYNEPNLDKAWPHDADGDTVVSVTWQNTDECIAPMMDNWLAWAERLIEMGAYPAFPALAENGLSQRATVYWYDAFLNYLRREHLDRFLDVANNGLWCATHPYLLNHFYQEPPGGPDHVARPFYQQSSDERGWHFEYPYDPILQHHDPGRTVFGATSQAPYGDPQGLIASGEAFQQLLHHRFAAGPVPVVGTAGGISPIPHDPQETIQPDDKYPPYTRDSHAEATLALWHWIAEDGPPWFFGLTLSDESEYYDAQGEVPAVALMEMTPLPPKEMPGAIRMVSAAAQPAEAASPASDEDEEVDARGLSADAPAKEPVAAEDIPGWIEDPDRLVTEDAADIVDDEDLPDWIDLDETDPAGATAAFDTWVRGQETALRSPVTDEEIPSWLDEADLEDLDVEIVEPAEVSAVGLEMPPAPEQMDEAEVLVGQEADEVPDWLAEAQPEGAPPGVEDEDLPPWLEEVDVDQDEAAVPVLLADDSGDEGMEMPPPPDVPVEEPSLAGQAADDIPDWLVEELGYQPVIAAPPAIPVADEDLPPWLEGTDIETVEGEPSGLPADMEEEVGLEMPPPPALPTEEAVLTGQAADDVPAWLEGSDVGIPIEDVPETEIVDEADQISALPSPQIVGRSRLAADMPLPENHWLMIAGSVDPRWFFVAGIRYWETYRPTLVHGGEDLDLIPPHETVAVTVLAPAKEADMIERQIAQVRPDAFIDVVICGTIEELTAEMNWRVATDHRFG